MILIVIFIILLGSIITLCTKNPPRNQSTSIPKVPNANDVPSSQMPPTPKDLTQVETVTPPCESPPKSQQANLDCASGGLSKGTSPANNTGTGTGTGTTPGNDATGTVTPQSSVKKKDQSNKTKENNTEKSENLMIETVSTVPDSLMERGNTTKTKDASKYTPPSRKKKGKRRTLMTEKTAKTLQSPIKKTQIEKKEQKLSPSGLREKGPENPIDEDIKEHTGEYPSDDYEKKTRETRETRDIDETKTKEDKRSVDGQLPTPPSIKVDSTQCSHTRKISHNVLMCDNEERGERKKKSKKEKKSRRDQSEDNEKEADVIIQEPIPPVEVAYLPVKEVDQPSSVVPPATVPTTSTVDKPPIDPSTSQEKKEDEEDEMKIDPWIPFDCSVCKLNAKCYYRELRCSDGFYSTPVFFMRDPFTAPPRVRGRKPVLNDFVVIGALCEICNQPSCLAKSCTLYFGGHFCSPCVGRERRRFPEKLIEGVAKARSVLSSYVDPALKDEKEEKNDEKIME